MLRLPKGRSVELYMRSLDVIHSVFVPEFSDRRRTSSRGSSRSCTSRPTALGTFPLECTELCGLGHSLMRSQAIVMEPAAFDAWLKQQEKSAAPRAVDDDVDHLEHHVHSRPRRPRRPASPSSTPTAARAATR